MTAENQTDSQIKNLILLNSAFKKEQIVLDKLAKVRYDLSNIVKDIDKTQRIKYTGWVVLLKKDGNSWICVRCLNVGECEEEILDNFDVVLPIPDPMTLPEFEGF